MSVTLSTSSRGVFVLAWQRFLRDVFHADVRVDGNYGPGTAAATRQYQLSRDLLADGVAGPLTLARARTEGFSVPSFADRSIAQTLGVEPEVIVAFRQVESVGATNAVRFEPHLFLRAKPQYRGQIPYTITEMGYSITPSETSRSAFQRAFALEPDLAVACTSWGAFQVLGEHLLKLERNPADAVRLFDADPITISDKLVIAWFRANPLALLSAKQKNWADLARRYNGRRYAVHAYDVRLKTTYDMARSLLP